MNLVFILFNQNP